ncbi:hypothetical protein [Streptomyces sp. NPDC051677]|uniref:hypothetical protein n=1 Tax=Streptomyces sp. NPDC051677 TaxID=3365669 RepID=UPI0037D01C08
MDDLDWLTPEELLVALKLIHLVSHPPHVRRLPHRHLPADRRARPLPNCWDTTTPN